MTVMTQRIGINGIFIYILTVRMKNSLLTAELKSFTLFTLMDVVQYGEFLQDL